MLITTAIEILQHHLDEGHKYTELALVTTNPDGSVKVQQITDFVEVHVENAGQNDFVLAPVHSAAHDDSVEFKGALILQ